jgi:hypothetical protein
VSERLITRPGSLLVYRENSATSWCFRLYVRETRLFHRGATNWHVFDVFMLHNHGVYSLGFDVQIKHELYYDADRRIVR